MRDSYSVFMGVNHTWQSSQNTARPVLLLCGLEIEATRIGLVPQHLPR